MKLGVFCKCTVLFFILLLIGCTQKEEVLQIGVIASLDGVGSYFGQQEVRGVELALEELNANGGVRGKRVELVIENSKTEQTTAVTSLNKLVGIDGVKFVIGDSWATTTFPLVPVATENNIVLISPIATLDELSQDDFFFRTMPITKDMVVPLADYAYNRMGVRKAGVILSETPFGREHARDFRAAFEKLGGRIVGEEFIDMNGQDVRSELSKLKSHDPDVVFNLHSAGIMGVVLKQAAEVGLDVKWLGAVGTENAILIKEYSALAEGIVYPYPYDANSELPSVRSFIDAYQKKYGELPDNTAANSYDALKILAAAIEQAGEDPVAVKHALLSFKDYPGGSGLLTFDKNGDVKKEIFIKTVRNGKFVKVSS
ncbi:ABC transporter substrate-binding protein [Candidatus Woesearchaeota archaeon]|nr:ABC transporter substrate-binding protein [Candidatus Woesearchaeota archaeon]